MIDYFLLLKLTVFYCHAEPRSFDLRSKRRGEASGLSGRKQRFIAGQILRYTSLRSDLSLSEAKE